MNDLYNLLYDDFLNPPELICAVPFYNVCGTNDLAIVEKFIQRSPGLSFMRDKECLVIHTDPCTTSFYCTSIRYYKQYKVKFTDNIGIINVHSFVTMLNEERQVKLLDKKQTSWNKRLHKLRIQS